MIVPDATIGFVRAAEKERRGMLASAPAKPEMRKKKALFVFKLLTAQFLTLNESLYSDIDMLYTTSFSYQLLTFGSTRGATTDSGPPGQHIHSCAWGVRSVLPDHIPVESP